MGCSKNKTSSVLDYVLYVFLISCLTIPKSVAQSPQAQSEFQYQRLSPPLAIIIIVLIAALFFMAAFSIYIRHCGESSGMTGSVRQALSMRRRAAAGRGIDAAVLETFPTFTYAEVKDHHIGKGALECAVCLNEFEDDETLRLIPKCDHVFHPECIDAWLQSHDTCPVCRANLTPQPGEPPVQVPELSHDEVQDLEPVHQQNDEVSIRIVSEEEQRGQQVQPPQEQQEEGSVRLRPGAKRNLSFNVPNRAQKQGDDGSVKQIKRFMSFNLSIPSPRAIIKPMMFSKFRSHSTGHSLVLPGENLDRYTLRLPEGVRKEVINRALLNRTKSFANDTKGYRNGEGSSRGGRFNRRIDRYEPEGKSDPWVFTIAPPFFSRGLSMKSPRVGNETGEGSTSGSLKSAVKLPSFKCLEPKSDETHLMSANRPPV